MSKVTSQYGKAIEICVSWQDAEHGSIPPRAIQVGESCFVARAQHNGNYIPGKFVSGHSCVYICYGGQEIAKPHYQILVDTGILNNSAIKWKEASGQSVPHGAILGGTDNGEPLYIAKEVIKSEAVIGKFQPEHGCAYFPYGGEEFKKESALVLCCVSQFLLEVR